MTTHTNTSTTLNHTIPFHNHTEDGTTTIERKFSLTFCIHKKNPDINLLIQDLPVSNNVEQNGNNSEIKNIVASKSYENIQDPTLVFYSELVNTAKLNSSLLKEIVAQTMLSIFKNDPTINQYIPKGYRFKTKYQKGIESGYDMYSYGVVLKESSGQVFLTSYTTNGSTKWTLPFARIQDGAPLEDMLFDKLEKRFNIVSKHDANGSCIVRGRNERNALNFAYMILVDEDINDYKNGQFFDMNNLPEGTIHLAEVIIKNSFDTNQEFTVLDLQQIYINNMTYSNLNELEISVSKSEDSVCEIMPEIEQTATCLEV